MKSDEKREKIHKVSVAVPSWDGRRHLEECLPALRAQEAPGVDWEVLVLDNGSNDGTAAWVRAEHPWVRLFESPANLGFTGGNDFLASRAEGQAIAFLNNDARPRPDWLKALVETLLGAPDDVAAVGGRIVDWEGERLDFGRGVMTFDAHAFQLDYGRALDRAHLPEHGAELLFPCGGNMIVRKESFVEAGGFDRDYFAYLEDVDLGWRLWSGGERVLAAPEAVVHHRSSATSEMLGLYNRGFLFERNAFLTAYKNYEPGLWERVMPAVLMTLLARTQTLLVQNNRDTGTLTLDPYAGLIANTRAHPEMAGDGLAAELARTRIEIHPPPQTLVEKWRENGTREMLSRALAKLARLVGGGGGGGERDVPRITDDRTIAQFRALTWLLGNLDAATEHRQRVQRRRQRPDREIFERFPLYVVPTYPGDEKLFDSAAFRSWLPAELPILHRRLDEVVAFDDEEDDDGDEVELADEYV